MPTPPRRRRRPWRILGSALATIGWVVLSIAIGSALGLLLSEIVLELVF